MEKVMVKEKVEKEKVEKERVFKEILNAKNSEEEGKGEEGEKLVEQRREEAQCWRRLFADRRSVDD